RETDGYKALEQAVKEMTPDEVIETVRASGLRGCGGAGFPTGVKWGFVPKKVFPKYVCVNADESEPGTFKDRLIIEKDPHAILEGALIAAYAIQAEKVFIYLRGEFGEGYYIMDHAIRQAYEAGFVGDGILGSSFSCHIVLHRGAGAYICGEETGLLESLEGNRGEPRMRPPFPALKGAFGQPTIINNAETLARVPPIILNGPQWYRQWGTEKSPGTRLFCLSGQIEKPGVYEFPLGTPLKDLIDFAGGVLGGRRLKAVIPGGSSAPMFDAETALKVTTDFEAIMAAGSFAGSAGIVVISEGTCMVKVALCLTRFYMRESCGKCTPCREGTYWLMRVLERFHNGGAREEDLSLLESVGRQMIGNCFCLLGDTAPNPLLSSLRIGRDDYEYHLAHQRCPEEDRGRV
ncbi:MAG: NADH-quinone oxidoreductase subunit NuoF, partial [Armatimonadetes bacterium]|nr:NADH-quinone oxidoreductase subunit NuoF [Armatimonadota bacterium]MDW8120918.1 NADH-quinone oxidoreductase subunit NuoF [Armatimonadota bacterium]